VPLLFIGIHGCASDPGEAVDEETIGVASESLLGSISYGQDCTSDDQRYLNESMFYGRVAAASVAFDECIAEAVTSGATDANGAAIGPYMQCNGDPFYGSLPSMQILRAIDMSRSRNDVSMNCSGGGGNASAAVNPASFYFNTNEAWAFNTWEKNTLALYLAPLCGSTPTPGCRTEPWPQNQAAGIMWHEASHTHGYTHGADDQANAMVACGYPSSTSFNFQTSTMPYIIQGCIGEVFNRAAKCANFKGCGSDALGVIKHFDSSVCECVEDPRATGIRILGTRSSNRLSEIERSNAGVRQGGWLYNPDNDSVSLVGDFNGNGRSDYLIRSGWGFGLVESTSSSQLSAITMYPWGTAIGGWTFASDQTFVRAGNLNADSANRDDVFVRSPSAGVAVFERSNSGSLELAKSYAYGTRLGWWVLGSGDSFVGYGNIDAAAGSEVVIRSGWGLGVLTMGAGELRQLVGVPWGTQIGGYTLNGTDQVVAVADFSGDGRDDILLQGASGIAILSVDSNNTFQLWRSATFGQRLGWWNLGQNDVIRGAGNFDGTGAAEFVISSDWGIGVITGTLGIMDGFQFGATVPGSNLDGYSPALTNWFGPIGDFNGDGCADFVLAGSELVVIGGSKAQQLQVTDRHTGQSLLGAEFFSSGGYTTKFGSNYVGDFDGDGRQDFLLVPYKAPPIR
jgi:hypothetical protein